MAGNASFPTPNPSLTDIETQRDDFQVKLAAAQRKGSPVETALKNASRAILEDLMRQLVFYINNIARGDMAILTSSGCALNQITRAGYPPDEPSGLKLSDGRQRGQIRLDFEPVPGAISYEYRYTSETATNGVPIWGDRLHTTSARNNVLAPVERAVTYYVQVRALNTHGASDWSYILDYLAR